MSNVFFEKVNSRIYRHEEKYYVKQGWDYLYIGRVPTHDEVKRFVETGTVAIMLISLKE